MKDLKEICLKIADLEGDIMYGAVSFSYDKMMSAMGCGHPAEILDMILAPVFWPVIRDRDVEISEVKNLYSQLISYKNSLQVAELGPLIEELRIYLQENGVEMDIQEIEMDDLRERYIGKTFNMSKFESTGDVCNLEIKNGRIRGHFYWNSEECKYYDEFSIHVDENLTITEIDPLETKDVDEYGTNPCEYTLVHNGQFDILLKAATE